MKVGSVLGHYHVVRTLGRGGMGAVYEANDTRLNRQVALKVLPAKMANNPEWFKRFEREAQAVAAINHPNIVTIHSVEEAEDVHFIILELVGGKTLDDLIPEGGLPIEQFFDIAIPLTDAIAAAHKRGIAHRDLKPSNVMVDDEGRVKVLDFGIAKLVDDVPDDEAATQVGSEALTEEGKIVGTVAYMSPEQAEGKAADHRSDIFSLGIMLYEMATGDRPFVGDTKLSIMASIVKDEPEPIIERNMEMPRHLARIVKKALEKKLSRRYQSMLELRNDLVELKEEIDAGVPLITGGTLTDPGSLEPYRAPTKANGWGKWVGLGGIVVAVAAVAWAVFGQFASEPAPGSRPSMSITPLTATAGVDFGGTISPDGQWFAYARQETDGSRIYLQAVGSRNPIPLSDGVSPAFSADGTQIAFSEPPQSRNAQAFGGGISIMGRAGDDVRRLTESGFNPAWSPDGSKIVFADEFVSSRPYSRSAQGSGLHIVDVATGDLQLLVRPEEDGVQPSWSPNGHRIAYWVNQGGLRDIWTIGVDGDGAHPVTQDAAVDFNPVWSPDGEWLYFASTRGGSMAIWRTPIDETSGEVLGEPEQITVGGSGDPGMLSISGDGTRLLYTETLTRGNIAVADFDPETLTVTSDPVPVVEGMRRLLQPDISADGEWLAYRTEGAQQDLFVAHTDGSGERKLTDNQAKEWAPRWSPDGSRIVYYSNLSGTYEVWVVDANATNFTRLTNLGAATPLSPNWSSDGSRVSYYVTREDSYLIDPAVSHEDQVPVALPKVPLPNGELGVFQSSDWNRDDTRIVGVVDTQPDSQEQVLTVAVYDVPSGEYEVFSYGTLPLWMADERRVIFRASEAAGFYVLDTATGDLRSLGITDAESVVLSPENLKIYVNGWDSESDIWMIDMRAEGEEGGENGGDQ